MEKGSLINLASRPYYKPFATKSPVLLTLFLITLALIALIEYACRSIPAHAGVGRLGNVMSNTLKINERNGLDKRQSLESLRSTVSFVSLSLTTSSSLSPQITSTPMGGYLSLGDSGPLSTTGAPNNGYLSVGNGPVKSTAPTAPAAPPSGYLSIGGGSAPSLTPVPQPPSSIDNAPATSVVTANGGDPTPNAGEPASSTNSDDVSAQASPASGSLNLGGENATTTTEPSLGSVVITSGQTTTVDPTPVAVNPSTSPGPMVIVSGDKSSTQLLTTIPTPILVMSNGKTMTQSSPTTFPTGAPNRGYLSTMSTTFTLPSKPVATIVNSTGTYYSFSPGNSTVAPQITLTQYLLVTFLPLLLTTLYIIPFRILETTIREMEPFYQLHSPNGALAEHSLCLDYSTSFLFFTPFKSLRRGHIFVFWSSLISIAVLALAPLAAEAWFVSLSGECGPNLPPCPATWGIYPLLARIIEGILAFIAILLSFMIILGLRRESGVFSEPLSIAGLTSLFYNSPLLKGFREIDSRVNNKQLNEILQGKRYGISGFRSWDGKDCYGILPADPDSEAGFAAVGRGGKKGAYSLVDGADDFGIPFQALEADEKVGVWERVKGTLLYVVVALITGGLLALIAYYHWSSGETGFEFFMDSQGFGVRFMMAAVGVLLKTLWSSIDQDIRKNEPYRALLLSAATSTNSILLPTHMSPITAVLPSLARGQYLVSLISFTAILTEFLPIALANVAFSPAMTRTAYDVCTFVSISILFIMLCSLALLICRPRKHVKPLPRKPNTLASVLLYVTKGEGDGEEGMLDQFEGLSVLKTRERNEVIKEWRGLYTLGVVGGNEVRVDDDRRIRRLWAD